MPPSGPVRLHPADPARPLWPSCRYETRAPQQTRLSSESPSSLALPSSSSYCFVSSSSWLVVVATLLCLRSSSCYTASSGERLKFFIELSISISISISFEKEKDKEKE
jgi:hypothetical protein